MITFIQPPGDAHRRAVLLPAPGAIRTVIRMAGPAAALATLLAACGPGAPPPDGADVDSSQAAAHSPDQGAPDEEAGGQEAGSQPGPATGTETVAAPEAAERPARALPPDIARDRRALIVLGTSVGPGITRRLSWSGGQSFDGTYGNTPVLVVNGVGDGPTLCLTAATHGDELNGIEIVRRTMEDLEADKLKGAVIGVPIVNLHGFLRGSRYLPDRRDLNRYFPGNPNGSAAARIASSFFENVVRHCHALVDVHTGSLNRTNLPQLRADLRIESVRKLADGFGGVAVLHSAGLPGTLRRAATDRGIPAVVLEAGEPARLQSASVREGTAGIVRLLESMGMLESRQLLRGPRPVYYKSTWIRADFGGILFSLVRLGQVVSVGDVLGTVTDPISNEQNLIYSPVRGRVLGMALNQVVMPGFAAFNIGIETAASMNGSLAAALEPPPDPAEAAAGPAAAELLQDDEAPAESRGEQDERPE